jgi:hypothetical protein
LKGCEVRLVHEPARHENRQGEKHQMGFENYYKFMFLLDFRENTFQNHFIRSLQPFCSGGVVESLYVLAPPTPPPQIPRGIFEI